MPSKSTVLQIFQDDTASTPPGQLSTRIQTLKISLQSVYLYTANTNTVATLEKTLSLYLSLLSLLLLPGMVYFLRPRLLAMHHVGPK